MQKIHQIEVNFLNKEKHGNEKIMTSGPLVMGIGEKKVFCGVTESCPSSIVLSKVGSKDKYKFLP